MKWTLKKWLAGVAAACVCLFLFGYYMRDFWFGQLRIYLLGLAEVRSDEFGYRMPDVDEIEVMTLGDADFNAPPGPQRVAHFLIIGRAVVRAEDARKVLTLWRSLRRGGSFSAMYHEPGYALRFRQRGKVIFETTICWHCHNYTIPFGPLGTMQYGFDADRQDAQALLRLLETFVPPPVKPSSPRSTQNGEAEAEGS